MASVYTNDLRLEEIGSGEQSGSWGDTTNTNLELIAEAFAFGTEAIPTNVNNSTHTTTIADGASDPGRAMFLKYTGSQNANVTVTIGPNTVSKLWFIENATTGSSVSLIIKQGSGAAITIPHGDTKAIYSNGAGSGAAMVDAFASLSVVDLKVQDDLTVTDDVAIGGILGVTGILTTTAHAVFNGGFDSNADSSLSTNKKLIFRDTAIHISSVSDGDLMIVADDEIDLTSTLIDVNGNLDVSGTALVTGVLTTTAATVFSGGFASNAASSIGGTTPTLTIGDAGAEDAKIVFDGNAADYHVGLDDSEDALQIGLGAALGTTPRITIRAAEVVVNDLGINLDFRVEASGSTHMFFVDASADTIGIGTTNMNVIGNNVVGTNLLADGMVGISRAGLPLKINRTAEGGIIELYEAGTARGQIDIASDRILVRSSGDASGVRFDASSLTPFKNGSAANGTVDLGFSSGPFRDLYLSGGVRFDANGEFLNDYEEGTFTPTWDGYSPAGSAGRFTKIGNQVFVHAQLTTGGSADFSGVSISNLPFTAANVSGVGSGMTHGSNITFYAFVTHTTVTKNTTICILNLVNNGGLTSMEYVGRTPQVGANSTMQWTIIYQAA